MQGRGSAANSAVCYSLGITAVDPVGMDLLFERFLSEERGEWPDIDLDLPSGDRRERVIQHVYQKYGKLGAAMTANVITYRGRSAAREVGKVLSLDAGADRSAGEGDEPLRVRRSEGDARAQPARRRHRRPAIRASSSSASLWQRIQDLPRHLGQHSGGMVICQGRLDEVVPLENATMPDRVVVQWDKDDCADMGLVKVDLLGLGMMAVLQDALTLVNRDRDAGLGARDSGERRKSRARSRGAIEPVASPEPRAPSPEPRAPSRAAIVDLAHLPPDDPAVYRMLQEADTIGIFQVESRAQMATLPRLKPAKFLRHRRRGRDHPARADRRPDGASVSEAAAGTGAGRLPASRRSSRSSARTLGVPLFQEQLLRMAMVAAGFSGGEAEELRRAMGFKRSEKRMQQIEGRLRERHGAAGHHRRRRPKRSSGRSRRSRCTAFPNRTPPASRCSSMRAPISRRTTRRRSIRRCSTTSRWGSIIRRRSSRTRSGTACASRRSTCRSRTGSAASSPTAGCVSA